MVQIITDFMEEKERREYEAKVAAELAAKKAAEEAALQEKIKEEELQRAKQSQDFTNPKLLHFRTVDDFAVYLSSLLPPSWFRKVAIHHTVVPTVAQWRGLPSLQAVLRYYQRLGWKSYPHLFVAPDGIWQMNNLLLRGTHANIANGFSIGIEVVGNYDNTTWAEPIYTYTLETILHLQKWRGLDSTDIVLHRDYNKTKSCPGKKITYDWIQQQLQEITGDVVVALDKYRVRLDKSRIRQGPALAYPVAGMLYAGDTFLSAAVKRDEAGAVVSGKSEWVHVTKAIATQNQVSDLGFVHSSLVEKIT